jgi:hypothetical protein
MAVNSLVKCSFGIKKGTYILKQQLFQEYIAKVTWAANSHESRKILSLEAIFIASIIILSGVCFCLWF